MKENIYSEEIQQSMELKEEIKKFNEALNDFLVELLVSEDRFKENVNMTIFTQIMNYKPVSIQEMEKIDYITTAFIDRYGDRITSYIDLNVNKILSKFEFLEKINIDVRKAMEIVYYRNYVINDDNTVLKRSSRSKDLITFNSAYDKSLEDAIFKGTFEQLDNELNLDVPELKEQLKALTIKYEETLITDKVSKLFLTFGNIKGTVGKTKVNTPALFFPVKLLDYDEQIVISPDFEREIEFNTDLIILSNLEKQVNTSIDLGQLNEIRLIENYIDDVLIKEVEILYEKNGITFDKELKFSKNITLGFYDVIKNPTQSDYTEILDSGFITENINKMFSNEEDISKKDELYGTINDNAKRIKQELIDNREYDVSYISKINFPQDKAVKGSKIYENIVIQGPPGTGKTEVITSIISDAILRGKKVLVSSEKLVALDVIKARLEELAKYAILFNREVETADFYDQLNLMITEAVKDRANQSNSSINKSDNEIIYDRNETRKEIIDFMKSYQNIFEYLKLNEIGKTYSWLYKNHSGFRSPESAIKKILNESAVIDIIKQNKLFVPKLYDVLFMINQKFLSPSGSTGFDSDDAILSKYPFLITHTKRTLTSRKISKTLKRIDELKDDDLFVGNDFTGTAKSLLKALFIDVKHLTSYIKSKSEMISIVEILDKKLTQVTKKLETTDTNNIFQALGNAWSITFERIVQEYKDRKKSYDIKTISNTIFDHVIKQILELKESSNVELQRNISNGNINSFSQMISKNLSEIVEKNITLAGRKLRDSLLNTLNESDRMLEIQSFIEHQKSRPISDFMGKYWVEIFSSVNIWLLPAETVPIFFPLVPRLFDIVVIDEASQLPVEKSIPLLYRAKRLIISGDDKQLKPSVNPKELIYTDVSEFDWEKVILPPLGLQDALKNKYANYLLNYHYRSEYAELISFSNSFFYNRNLYVSTPKAYSKDNPPIKFIKTKGKNVAGKNAVEANEVVKKVLEHIKNDNSKTIGIVSFTKRQKEVLEEKLLEAAKKHSELDLYIRTNNYSANGEDTSLFVKNVSEVQGDERDTIIFSTTFAPNDKGVLPTALGDISLENGENMLNVAITRAKSKLIVVSSINPNDLDLPRTDRGGELLKHFLYYAQAFQFADERTIRNILKLKPKPQTKVFESRMHEEIFNLIKNAGYNVEYQFGFDNYVIDFVIKNENGDIVVGVNLDNELYLRNYNTMEREYYLPTYLEARGWNILRVWSHQWSQNPDEQNAIILQRIEESIKTFVNGTVISLFEKGHISLDFKTEDMTLDEFDDEEKLIDEGEQLISERYREIRSLAKQIRSEKHQEEEKRWLREYEAMEARGGVDLEEEIGQVLDKEFLKATSSKSMEGIEDSELEDLVQLSNKKSKDEF